MGKKIDIPGFDPGNKKEDDNQSIEKLISLLSEASALRPIPSKKIKVREHEYQLPKTEQDVINFMLLVALAELDNPAVNEVLKGFGIELTDVNGKQVFPRNKEENKDDSD